MTKVNADKNRRPIMSRVVSSYGEQVSTNRSPVSGGLNIKGQNSLRQAVFGVSIGLATGTLASLTWFAGNMNLFSDSLPGLVVAGLTYAAVAIVNAYRGKPIEDIAKEITDQILGEENDVSDR